jgi:hypothetical protein
MTQSGPDRYLLVKDRSQEKTVSWANVVLSCEYKRIEMAEELDDVSIHRYSSRTLEMFKLCYVYPSF